LGPIKTSFYCEIFAFDVITVFLDTFLGAYKRRKTREKSELPMLERPPKHALQKLQTLGVSSRKKNLSCAIQNWLRYLKKLLTMMFFSPHGSLKKKITSKFIDIQIIIFF
jgi:hypothetical protein